MRTCAVRSYVRRSPAKPDVYVALHDQLRVELAMEEACREILNQAGVTHAQLPDPGQSGASPEMEQMEAGAASLKLERA